MTPASSVADAIPTQSLALDLALKRQSRIAALAYAALCVYYLAVLLITLAKVPWASFDQVASDLSGKTDTIAAVAMFMVITGILAICALKIFALHRWAFWCVVLAAMLAGLAFLGIFVLSAIAWRSPDTGSVGLWTISVSTAQVLVYGFCAALLFRIAIVTRRQRKQARLLGMPPRRTTTL